jgi:hypothetical protein
MVATEEQRQTAEGTRLQLISSSDKTTAIVVSTLMEAWEVVRAGLVADGTVKDVSDLCWTNGLR